jgi:hypothetical protein
MALERVVRVPAGDPALCRPRRRPFRSSSRHPVRHLSDRGAVRPDDAPVDHSHRPRRQHLGALLRDGDRMSVHRPRARLPGAGAVRGQDLPHRALAAPRRRFHLPGRRRDRHRILGHSGSAGDRTAGGASHGVSTHAELLDTFAQRTDDRGVRQGMEIRLSGAARAGTTYAYRHPEQPERCVGTGSVRCGTPPHLRRALGSRRHQLHGGVQRPDCRSAGQRHRGQLRT